MDHTKAHVLNGFDIFFPHISSYFTGFACLFLVSLPMTSCNVLLMSSE